MKRLFETTLRSLFPDLFKEGCRRCLLVIEGYRSF